MTPYLKRALQRRAAAVGAGCVDHTDVAVPSDISTRCMCTASVQLEVAGWEVHYYKRRLLRRTAMGDRCSLQCVKFTKQL
jgi:hypothetical protein